MWDFDAARRERQAASGQAEPVRFLLGGEVFTIIDRIPLGDTIDLIEAPDPTPETETEAVVALTRFIDRVLIDQDRPRFAALLRRREDPIDAWDIIEVGERISRHYTHRPTVPSGGSSSGRAHDGETSSSTGIEPPEEATSST